MNTIILLILFSIFQFSVQAEVISVNTPVKDQNLIKLVNESVTKLLEYSDNKKAGGLDSEVKNPTIFEITKKNKIVTKIRIRSEAEFTTTDYDMGDPVDEVETVCVTTLNKDPKQNYFIHYPDSFCDFDPNKDLKNEQSSNPCCDGGPVVDSNMCFDSYEEGLEACKDQEQIIGEYE